MLPLEDPSESLGFLFEILDGAAEAAIVYDSNFRFVYLNAAAERQMLRPRETLLGQILWDAFPESVDRFQKTFKRAASERVILTFEGEYSPTGGRVEGKCVPVELPAAFSRRSSGAAEGQAGATEPGLAVYFRDVTDRKEAERARAAERETMGMLNRINDAFVSLDRHGTFLYANPEAVRLSGTTEDSLVGKNHWQLFPQLRGTRIEREYQRVLREQTPVHFEHYYDRAGKWLDIRAFPAPDEGLYLVFRDVTAEKRAERTLLRREREFAAVAETAIDIMARFDRQLRLLYANQAIERHTGVAPDALVGKPLDEIGFPLDTTRVWSEAIQKAFATDLRQAMRYRSFSPVLGERWYEASITPDSPRPETDSIASANETDMQTVIVIARDITEQRNTEAALRESEERLRLATAAADMGTWDYQPLTREAIWDRRCKELSRVPADARVDYSLFREGVHPEDRDRIDAAVERALDPNLGGEFDVQYRLTPLFGETEVRWLSARGKAFFGETASGGKIAVRLIGTVMDITQAKERETEREALVQKQRRFLREMLLGFTEGRLRLCDTREDLPMPLPRLAETITLTPHTVRILRKSVALLAQNLGLSNLRIMDLETAVGEAAMNAVRHAAGGEALVRGDAETGLMQVWIEDAGTGIAEDMIHRAVERGFTTGGFGQGFFLMRSCVDRVYLLTGPRGTTVVLEVERNEPDPAWLADYTQAS